MWLARFSSPCRFVLAGFLSLLCLLALPARAADRDELVDPPSRALRLNYLSGTASFAPADSDDWEAATINRPLTQGDRLWVEKGERAELHVGSTVIRLAGATGLEVLELGDADLKLKLTQGSLSLRVRDYPDDEVIEIDTPNLAFEVGNPGEYRFDVNPDRDTTTVSARRGSGSAYSDDEARPPVRVNTGQRLRFDGRDLFVLESASVGPRDEFDRWVAQRDDREDASLSARYVSREMTGYEDLDAHGDWRDEPGYGAVWVPRITISNWAPYHHGHWAWVLPWGWTWVDDAPWGFAPFHYGRWAYFGSRWCWVPGPMVRRPVYAPALVAFVGGRSGGVSISLSTGLPGVAWFALGPNEPYRPAYRHRPEYLGRVNPHITVNRTVNVYVNQRAPHAVAVMPERDFVRGAATRPGQVTPQRDHDLTRLPVRESVSIAPVRERSRDAVPTRNVPERVFRRSVVGQQRISQDRLRSPAERQGNAPGMREERSRESGAPRSGPERRENPSERLPAMRSEGPSSERQPVRESREERRLPGSDPAERRDGRRNDGPRAEDRNPARTDPRQPDQPRSSQDVERRRQQQDQQQESQRQQGQQQEQQRQQEQAQQRQRQEQDQRQQEQGRRQQQEQEQRRQQELQGQQRQQQEQEQQRRQQEQQAQQRQRQEQDLQRQRQEQEQRQQEQGRRQQQEQEQRRQQELQGQQRQQQEQEQQRRQQEQQAQQRQRQEQDLQRQQEQQQRQQEQLRRQQEAQRRESRQPEARQPERRPDKRGDEDEERKRGGGRGERR
ncbi:hypothetical protein GCM10027046_02190 [Uliginosibacterium flavum]|uniref:DUF6600 domain-containing protein n=1 Tax=Uliginosibacterium flavum TaxID=1396831 RepID=A0ABV2THQ3_9RHOO